MTLPEFIIPDWNVPATIKACVSTRTGGCSRMPYESMNLGAHVGDDPNNVASNRQKLAQALALPGEPFWLNQVHGNVAVLADSGSPNCDADASITRQTDTVCAVMTADCLPVLFCSAQGDEVAAAHTGWRGLADGILESTLALMAAEASQVTAWLGPAIGPTAFEVGEEVRTAFIRDHAEVEQAFKFNRPGHWLADIYQLACIRLTDAGVTRISGGEYCTYTDRDRFFSYRRDGATGRMASLIWINHT